MMGVLLWALIPPNRQPKNGKHSSGFAQLRRTFIVWSPHCSTNPTLSTGSLLVATTLVKRTTCFADVFHPASLIAAAICSDVIAC